MHQRKWHESNWAKTLFMEQRKCPKKEQDGIVNESFFIRWLESTAETYKHTTQIREIAQNIKCWLLQVFVCVRMYSGYVYEIFVIFLMWWCDSEKTVIEWRKSDWNLIRSDARKWLRHSHTSAYKHTQTYSCIPTLNHVYPEADIDKQAYK